MESRPSTRLAWAGSSLRTSTSRARSPESARVPRGSLEASGVLSRGCKRQSVSFNRSIRTIRPPPSMTPIFPTGRCDSPSSFMSKAAGSRRSSSSTTPRSTGLWEAGKTRERLSRVGFRHLALAPGVERVVERTLELDLAVILLAVHDRETERDGLQAGSLRGEVDVGSHVSAVHDHGEPVERWILQPVLEDDRLEAAPAVDVA